MAKAGVVLRRNDSLLDQLEAMHQQISQRAYELFRMNGSPWNNPVEDWLNAERELLWQPSVELRRKDGQFEVLAAVAGVDAKDLDVQVTPDDLLIKGNSRHEHRSDTGTVHVCEFSHGQLFRSVHFPEPIDTAGATAECRDGLLRVTAPIAQSAQKKNQTKSKS
jgi:HSP20 family molecular chaperone IbpA